MNEHSGGHPRPGSPDRPYDAPDGRQERHDDAGDNETGHDGTELDGGRHARSRGAGRRLLAVGREGVIVIILALVLSSLVKTFLMQPFWIPSDSMNDTLVRNDRVIVSKLTPGPFDLARGDVIVFEDPGYWLSDVVAVPKGEGFGQTVKDGLAWVGILPSQEDNHLIKRVIGLPGDHVKCCSAGGKLEVNGVEVTEPYVFAGDKPSTIPFDIRVPVGKVWVMGDHRSNSRDSRYNDTDPQRPGAPELPSTDGPAGKDRTGFYGSVPIDKVVGRAVAIVWPLDRTTSLGGQGDVFGQVPAPTAASAAAPPAASAVGEPWAGVAAAGTP